MKKLFYGCGIFISTLYFSQEKDSKLNVSFLDGIAVTGYVDHGAFLNFTGPNINFTYKNTKLMIGMLPSLRIKQDQSSGTKNSTIMPTLGIGFAVIYKKIALQIPFYYNTKTSIDNGSWKPGIGIGFKFK
ncbi:hypothetical protein [Chryseobacterium balustinum]|uniref:Outer membrane protein beta-barrel domain-containing protein n=1 Tax=Chryseobacterium balustinum TaxID=246 RepID=A0ABY1LEN7_9FLAO|nr:hypothetical protein [Chryseobacterium balustinum]AZB29982.1 hypothetical protein EB354_12390 [Chryseobacterium balustinum]SKC05176.1 hypothetical protein SAMN05421800_12436 [Chryseobacterium balustinum]